MSLKYNVREDEFDGELFSVSPLQKYESGNGSLRTIVIRVRGMFNEMVYVPITVFGADALDCTHAAVGRPITVTARLRSVQYDKNGETKWFIGYNAAKVELGQKSAPTREPEPPHEQVSMDDPGIKETMPF